MFIRLRHVEVVLVTLLVSGLAGGCWEKKKDDNTMMLALVLVAAQHKTATVIFTNTTGAASSPYLSRQADCSTAVAGAAYSSLPGSATSPSLTFDPGSYYACNHSAATVYNPSPGTYSFTGGSQTIVTLSGTSSSTTYTYTAQ